MVSIDLGWILIILGLSLLIAEVVNPGFFIAVPGTILIVIGILILLIPDVAQDYASVIIIVTTIVSSILTIIAYKKIAPPKQKPITTSMDTLIDKQGIVIETVLPDSLSGKVKINNQVWSASGDKIIEKGKKVIVVGSEGVHVIVKEV